MLDRVGLPAAKFPLSRYPHELSGGQRQRVVIAIACALKPKLLIADEPTTALDVVLQAQILDLLRDLVDENRMGLLLISHDLAVVTEMADRITIMRDGEVMEAGDTAETLSAQAHPYTRQLAQASMHVPAARAEAAPMPPAAGARCSRSRASPATIPAAARSLFAQAEAVPRGRRCFLLHGAGAVDGAGRPLRLRQVDARPHDPGARRADRRHDPLSRRDDHRPRPGGAAAGTARHAGGVPGPLRLVRSAPDASSGWSPSRCTCSTSGRRAAERRELVAAALHEVGLQPADMQKYPHEFSGGQRQRLSIARAIITRPKLIVADEPVSALDVSIRAQILDLFADLNQRLGIAYLFITHDLTVARAITDEVMVMDDGRIVETRQDRPRCCRIRNPQAAKALVDAAPDLHRAIARRMQEQG